MEQDDATLRLREEGLNWREIDGEVIVLDVQRSHYLNLNPTGSAMWLMLADGATEPQLVDRLTQEFEVDEQTAREDVATFLAICRENGLLTTPGDA
ncbi:MAG: PqqD family protein [Solirubrobacteraceae bacterium]